jgi:uncharacterized protein (TIGR00266 family)
MRHAIEHTPSYSLLEVTLDSGETVVSDAGAMAWMDAGIDVKTTTRGGILKGLKRALLAGESFFQNTYTARRAGARIGFAPGAAGDIRHIELRAGELFLQKGAYLASAEGVRCDAKFDGLRGFFNEGLFILRVTGTGDLFFNSYGDIQEIDVQGEYVVDNGFAVAWEPSLSYRLSKARKIRSFLFSDQILLRFSGRGRVWVQSRSPHALASWVHPFRPRKKNN